MKIKFIAISTIISMTLIGCDSSSDKNAVPVDFNKLSGDPSTQELKTAEICLSKFATKLEKDLIEGMASAGFKNDIFSISAHKIFTDSQNNVNVQYSISGMTTLPSGKEQIMDNKKEMINCSSQNI